MERIYIQGEVENAVSIAKSIKWEWQKSVNKMDMLLYHDYIDNISSNIQKLEILIEEKDTTSLLCTCKETVLMLDSLRNSEYPTAENII